MSMIEYFLNRKNSLRELSDSEFDHMVDHFAEELSQMNYCYSYRNIELHNDWKELCKYDTTFLRNSASTTRIGLKLCEHFFPNFFEIRNAKGQSFANSWTKENLVKILKWNRKSHHTPYLSELRRGVYFCCGLTKNTMFRPHIAKTVCANFSKKTVLDPCCGWGGRMLGALAAGKYYIGFEPNGDTHHNLLQLADFLNARSRVEIYNDGAENMTKYDFKNVDLILTSPPYFNLEIYSESKLQSENMFSSYDEWRDEWLKPVIHHSLDKLNNDGYSAWNVHNVGKMKMISDVEKIHKEYGYDVTSEISLSSSKRQANNHRQKNNDLTRVFYSTERKQKNAFLEIFS